MEKMKTMNILFYWLKGQGTWLLLGMTSCVSSTESVANIGNK